MLIPKKPIQSLPSKTNLNTSNVNVNPTEIEGIEVGGSEFKYI